MKNVFADKGVKNLLDQKGFTLVEMLVVVAIIAILASVFLVGLSGFRQSAYDARRLSDMQNIQTYLERYYNIHQGYPTTDLNTALRGDNILSNNQSIPADPAGGSPYLYAYCGQTTPPQSYVLGAQLSKDANAWHQGINSLNGCTLVSPSSGAQCTSFATGTPPAPGSSDYYCIQF